MSVSPETGTVPCSTRKRCQLAFCPPGRLALAGCDLLLKVSWCILGLHEDMIKGVCFRGHDSGTNMVILSKKKQLEQYLAL